MNPVASIILINNSGIIDPLELTSVDEPTQLSAAYNTAYGSLSLPSTVTGHFDDGSTASISVTWAQGSYNAAVAGTYTLTGTINPSGFANPSSLTATIDVTVLAEEGAVSNTNDGWTKFNGYSNYAKWGDILDTVFFATTLIKFRWTQRNVPLTGTKRIFSKAEFSTNQRSLLIQKLDNDLSFSWYPDGTSTRVRVITWADCLADTNQHTIEFRYTGSVTTNAGLDRIDLYIDGVLVSAGKSLTTNTGTIGGIFNGTAQLAFGTDVNAAGTVSTGTTIWVEGEFKDLEILSVGDVVEFHGLDVDPITPAITGTYRKYMQPILNGTKNSSAQDTCQVTINSVVDTGTHYYLYYLASNPSINSDRDETCLAIKEKSNDITTGWTKQLSAGLPQIVYTVGAVGKFDAKQCWLRNVRKKDDGTYEAWPVGQSALDAFAMGYATSTDGITWTRGNSGDAVFNDGTTGFTIGQILYDSSDSKYKMLYTGNTLGAGIKMVESSDGLTWSAVHSSVLFGESLGWPVAFKKFDSDYYIWAAKRLLFSSGISEEIALYKTADFSTFSYLGTQVRRKGGTEFGLTSTLGLIQLPNENWCLLHTGYKNQIGKSANLGEEFTYIFACELNRNDLPIAGKECEFVYPSYVIEHYPLNREENSGLNFNELANGGTAVINTTPVYTQDAAYGNRTLGFVDLNGSQNITNSATLPGTFDPANFGIKLRVEIVTTGTHNLFQIGDAVNNKGILITLESGKMRVRLSADGTNWTKDWVRTVNLAKPTGMNYIDNHIYLGCTLIAGTLTLFNDFETVSAADITETVDGAVASMHYTNGSRIIGENATLEIRSISILSGATNQQLIDLEI